MGPLAILWIRAAALVGQSLVLGGAVFALAILRGGREPGGGRALDLTLMWVGAGGLLVAATQTGALIALAATFADAAGWPIGSVVASTAGAAALVRLAAGLAVAGAAWWLRRARGSRAGWAALLVAAAVLPLASAAVSHAMGGLEPRAWLVPLAALHQTAAATWVGGLVCAIVAGATAADSSSVVWLRRFSPVAASSVAVLALTGIALSLVYVGSPGAAIGTSYGAMTLAKIAIFSALLAMAWLNHRRVHGRLALGRRSAEPPPALAPTDVVGVRRRLEVECALAIVALVLAASIASTPPAVDAGTQQASLAEIARVLGPGWPRLQGPSLAELEATSALGDPDAPRTPEEKAWSEFGHNMAGLFILALGIGATLEATGRAPWARHWPLLIVGLTIFVAWSLDPEGWQTGRVGFWEHLLSPEVLQHRLMLALTATFGIAEWWVRTPRGSRSRWRYAFPVVCLASGTLLLTHVHEVGDAKSAFLMEIAHIPLGLVLLVAGWARWLELRLPPALGARHGRIWGPALAVFGLLLVFYREG